MLPYGGVIFVRQVGRSGFLIMLAARWVMVGIPGFGWMAGLVEWRLVSDLAGCMICRWIGRYQCLICFRVGGVLLMVRRGDGGGGCLCGRRRCWGILRYFFRM